MKRIITLGALALTTVFASCSKNDDSNATTPAANIPAANTWTVDGATVRAAEAHVSSGFLSASDASQANGITFYFYKGNIPTKSRTYKVVRKAASDNEIDFGVLVSLGPGLEGAYFSADDQNVNVTVNVAADGKLSLSVPSTIMTNESGGIIKHVAANLAQQ